MTIDEARQILGLGPGEEALSHLGEFVTARELIAEMVRTAPNDTIALRYQEGLMEFDQALAAVREELERLKSAAAEKESTSATEETLPPSAAGETDAVPPTAPLALSPVAAATIAVPDAPPVTGAAEPASASDARADEPPPFEAVTDAGELPEVLLESEPREVPADAVAPEQGQRGRRRRFPVGAVLLAFLVVGCGGGWLWQRIQEDLCLQRQARISFLERQGAAFVENRRWEEATAVYREIHDLDPASPLAAVGRRSIEAGMAEEQNQFLGYWQGEALAAFEAGRWDDAERAIRTVLAKVPDNPDMVALQGKIGEERRLRERASRLEKGRKALESNRWDEAAAVAQEMLVRQADDREASDLLAAANAGREQQRRNREQALELLAKAQQRDTGEFDPQAVEWVREAARLAPDDPDVAALYQKLSAYTRTVRVPGDFATIGAALAAARPKDRIVVGKGVWQETLVVNRPVEIEGVGGEETVIECPAGDSPVATFDAEADGARVKGLSFRHVSFSGGSERYSAVVVRGGRVVFEGCRFRDASGHGLAVIDGGTVAATACRFEANGWDGAAAYGEGSRLEIVDSQTVDNIEHGIDAWNGAALVVRGSLARGNGRNGIYVATPAEVLVDHNKAEDNREFGIVVAAGKGGKVSANSAARNGLGGLAFHRDARQLEVRGNTATRNEGPGLVLDEGFAPAALDGNDTHGNNSPAQILESVKLDATAEIPEKP